MAPSTDTSLELLQARRDLAETKFTTADIFVRALSIMLAIAATAHLATFGWITPDRKLIGFALLCAIAALSLWTIGLRFVDRLHEEFLRAEQAIDEYLNLPVS